MCVWWVRGVLLYVGCYACADDDGDGVGSYRRSFGHGEIAPSRSVDLYRCISRTTATLFTCGALFSKQNHPYRIMHRALGHSRGRVRRERPTHRISCHCARAPREQGGKPPHKCCTFQPVSPGYPAQSNAMVYATARRQSQSIPPRSCVNPLSQIS